MRDNTFLVVRSNGKVVWSDVPSTRQSLTEEKLVSYVEYLIDSIYVNLGNGVYRQCVGIPMCAPLLPNLFLFFYEYRYMKGLIKNNIHMARRFNNTMRFVVQCPARSKEKLLLHMAYLVQLGHLKRPDIAWF